MKSITQVVQNLLKPYIDNHDNAVVENIAPVETDETSASQSYAIGKQLILDGTLYDVIAAITAGDALVVNTNIRKADDISDTISALSADVADKADTADVNAADNDIYKVMGQMGAKNLIPFPYYNDSPHTTNGITFTVNPDGSVTASGTASADAYFRCTYTSGDKHIALLADTDYILSGTGIASVAVLLRNSGGSNVASARATNVTYSCTSAGSYDIILLVENGTDLTTPLTIYPMLRFASDTDNTYQPYAKTNSELTAENGALTNEIDKAYKTDDAAISEVASDDLLPIYDTSAAAKKKIAVNNFIGGLVSNPNLLDNPWFTVNQRGQSSYSGEGYTVDRWKLYPTDNTKQITVNNGVSIESGINCSFLQYIDDEVVQNLRNRNVTISILLSDGSIIKNTLKFPATDPATTEAYGNIKISDSWYLRLIYVTSSTTHWRVEIHTWGVSAGNSLSFRAVKLEIGDTSTLAMDTAPNYATELLKCQRYFFRYKGDSSGYIWVALGMAYSTNGANFLFNLPVNMRSAPILTVGDLTKLAITQGSGTNNSHAINAIFILDYGANKNTTLLSVQTAVSDLVNGDVWKLNFTDYTNYLDISADL